MKISNNIKFYRQQKEGLTQAKLAKMVGISERHYQKIEYGLTEPNVYTAQRIAIALGTTVEDLFPLPSEKTSPLQTPQHNNNMGEK